MRPNVLTKIDITKPIRNGPTAVLTSNRCSIVDFDLYITDFDEVNNDLRDRFVEIYESNLNTITVDTDYTAGIGDILLVDSTSGLITITIPDATFYENNEIFVKKISSDANNVVLSSTSGIDGKSEVYLKQQWTTINLVSDGTEWKILGMLLCYPT